jgi:SAM-dependent methyltransferase
MKPDWKSAAREFFGGRAERISCAPSIEELCYVSGRDARIWASPAVFAEMIDSILAALEAGPTSRVLEVGCAAGYIARGLALRVGSYIGVDLAHEAVASAARLGLPKARFQIADGGDLPFADNSFDGAVCYDVLTNFPEFAPVAEITAEMIRVVRPGGKVLIGSIPDANREAQFVDAVRLVQQELENKHGPLAPLPPNTVNRGWRVWFLRGQDEPRPERGSITCYYFARTSFVELGSRLAVETEILQVHPLNPYADYRFNVVFNKSVVP